MKDKIQNILQQIEQDNNIKIIFAIENGSRSWGMASKDSDFDVRFVFKRALNDYITLNPQKNVIVILKLPTNKITGRNNGEKFQISLPAKIQF